MQPIVIDQAIPYLPDWLQSGLAIQSLPAAAIDQSCLKNANATGLIVRTETQVNAALLADTSVRWVASATAGIDHLDLNFLQQRGIDYYHAPGANALAVAEYVFCCIAVLRETKQLPTQLGRVGVIGVGHVGSMVARWLQNLGYQVLQYDPPRALRDPAFQSCTWEELHHLDLVCIHPALTVEGRHPSVHLLDQTWMARQRAGTVVINAARGEILDEQAFLAHGQHLLLCTDVWANEPNINQRLLQQSILATPHIAGYSKLAKWRASVTIYQQLQQRLGLQPLSLKTPSIIAEKQLNSLSFTPNFSPMWEKRWLQTFDPRTLDQVLRNFLASSAHQEQSLKVLFTNLRRAYILRDEINSSMT